jgi:hypothetical protein
MIALNNNPKPKHFYNVTFFGPSGLITHKRVPDYMIGGGFYYCHQTPKAIMRIENVDKIPRSDRKNSKH